MQLSDYASKIIRERRSIFPASYSGERVKDEIIEEMIENARWAPTHKLTQPWRFTVFADEGLSKLAEYQGELYRENAGLFDQKQFEKLTEKPLQCSHIIAIGMLPDPEQRVPRIEEVCAVACAVQNMLLTASSHGVGCYWSTGGITYYDDVSALFEGEDEIELLGFLYLGMPREGFWPEGNREPMEDKVTWVIS